MAWMIGVDTGGTFTDLIAVEERSREMRLAKVASEPADPSLAVMNALEQLLAGGIEPRDIAFLAHGTTVATNALLEGKGAPTGLVITRGFRAVYEARGASQPSGPSLIDPFYVKPPLLVRQRFTHEVSERIDARGEIVTALVEDDVRRAARRILEQGLTSVAVCYLFSFLNDAHERRTAEIIAEVAPGLRVSLSSSVLPVVREYVRLSTTAVDAYVGPTVATYVGRLVERLEARGIRTPQLYMMQSNGGLVSMAQGSRFASQLLLSGPAAGLIAAADLGRVSGEPSVVTFDMGGTSADIGVIIEGRIGEAQGGVLAGQDIGTPMLRVRTLGAGGGTIAWIGKDGLLKVGPQSAGAAPGPACYGRGGGEPTVTDANLVLGALGTDALAGNLVLDRKRAEAAIRTRVAEPLGLDVMAAADGIIRIVNNKMAVDLRLALQEQGQDPRRFALMSFGGAGGLHAAELARMVGIPRVLIPVRPGLNCALGLLQTAVRHQYLRSSIRRLDAWTPAEIEAQFSSLAAHALADAAAEGFAPSAVTLGHRVEMRYLHQGYQLAVPCPNPFGDGDHARLKQAFDELHRATYGQAAEGEAAEIVTFRLEAEIEVPRLQLPPLPQGDGDPGRALVAQRPVWDLASRRFLDAKVYDRSRLRCGDRIAGPAVLTQLDATTLLLAGQSLSVDACGTLVIEAAATPAG